MPKRTSKLSLKERRRRARNTTMVLVGILLLSLLALIAVVVRIPETKVIEVHATPAVYAKTSSIEGVVRDMIQGTHFLLIPRSHTFFIPFSSIKTEIEKTFPSIKNITIKRDGFTALSLVLEEEVPAYVWCHSLENDSSCYLMNSDGYVFAHEDHHGDTLVRFSGVIDESPIGQWYLPESFRSFADGIASIEGVVGEKVVSAFVDANDDVTLQFKGGGKLQFVRTASYAVLLDNIASVFSSKKMKREEELEYADFRFGNKVYVKFIGE